MSSASRPSSSPASMATVLFAILGASLIHRGYSDPQIEVIPRSVTVLPGGNVTMLCRVAYKLTYCRIQIPGQPPYVINKGDSINGITYYGTGLEEGQCGVSIDRVNENHNGKIECLMPPNMGFNEIKGTMDLIVARAPDVPYFEETIKGRFKEGQMLNIRCVIPNARPVANITWFLDDEPLFDGLHMTSITNDKTTGLETISQNLTRRISSLDNNRVLSCIAGHIAADPSKNKKTLQIQVDFPPKNRDETLYVFGIKIGENGVINVTAHANPEPSFEWKIAGGYSVGRESIIDDNGRQISAQIVPLGSGYYNITLVIPEITREDTEHDFKLTVSNNQGSAEYNIRVSTLNEPEGVDLSIGGIVGIVIAVLVLLIVIFLIIFAKATDRWCFGERGEKLRKSQNAGETSDTESTDATARSKNKNNPEQKESTPMVRSINFPKNFNLKSFLPGGAKNKDKVAQLEASSERMESKIEEEKPLQTRAAPRDQAELVYAELALKPTEEQENRPAQERTEYAEIVYNNQPIENKMETKAPESK